MKKRTFAALTAAALLLVLCACGGKGNPLPEGMDETALLDAGRAVVTQLNDRDWQGVYQSLRPDGRETTTPEAIQAVVEPILDKAGALQRETDAMATGQTLESTGEEYGTAVFYYKHEKKSVSYRIAFSAEMELMGLEVQGR